MVRAVVGRPKVREFVRISTFTCGVLVAAAWLVTDCRVAGAQAAAAMPAASASQDSRPTPGTPGVAGAQVEPATATIPLPDLQHITPASRADVERDAVQYVRAVQATALDPDLPDTRLDRWLDSVLHLPAQWAMSECGIERRDGQGPICVRVTQSSRGLDLQIAIGTTDRGVLGRPRLVSAGIRLFDIDSGFERLAYLPDMLVEADARRQRFAEHPLQTLAASDLQRLRGVVQASTLQPDLPGEPFEAWLRKALPSDVPAEWALVSCNPMPNAAAPQCINIDVRWPAGARARVMLDLEMVQRGLARDPAFRMAFIYPGPPAKSVNSYRSLREFAEALTALAASR